MADFPNTRISLILRLAQAEDVQAWQEFAEVYAPVLYRLSLAKGLQSADAEDVTQDILFAVARAAERFEANASRARFRTWLTRVARNLIADFYAGRAKRPASQTISDSWLQSVCEQDTSSEEFDSSFDIEYRRSVFQAAARRVRNRVSESSWHAFELTAVKQIPATEAAEQTGLALGSLYVARCRVMKMLRAEIESLEGKTSTAEVDSPASYMRNQPSTESCEDKNHD